MFKKYPIIYFCEFLSGRKTWDNKKNYKIIQFIAWLERKGAL